MIKLTESQKRRIRENNKRWREADEAGKRVLIAKDVIQQVKMGNFTPSAGIYWGGALAERARNTHMVVGRDVGLREVIMAHAGESCEVCAIGSMFLCSVRLGNEATVSEGGSASQFSRLRKYFSAEQLALIESAFECQPMGVSDNWIDRFPAVNFGKQWPKLDDGRKCECKPDCGYILDPTLLPENDAPRMLAIMKNIVKNNGEFIP